jgi:HEPN domain-containing protein
MGIKEEILFFKKRALESYDLSKKAFEDRKYAWSLFLLEQACQLMLKYFLALKVGYFSKTRDLKLLFEEASEISKEFEEFYSR